MRKRRRRRKLKVPDIARIPDGAWLAALESPEPVVLHALDCVCLRSRRRCDCRPLVVGELLRFAHFRAVA